MHSVGLQQFSRAIDIPPPAAVNGPRGVEEDQRWLRPAGMELLLYSSVECGVNAVCIGEDGQLRVAEVELAFEQVAEQVHSEGCADCRRQQFDRLLHERLHPSLGGIVRVKWSAHGPMQRADLVEEQEHLRRGLCRDTLRS
jgi:hypothetical protein